MHLKFCISVVLTYFKKHRSVFSFFTAFHIIPTYEKKKIGKILLHILSPIHKRILYRLHNSQYVTFLSYDLFFGKIVQVQLGKWLFAPAVIVNDIRSLKYKACENAPR